MDRIREGVEAMDFEGLGTALHELFDRVYRSYPRRVGKYVISRSLAETLEQVGGRGSSSQYAVYDEVWPEPAAPPGYKRLPNGRLMPIVQKGSGPPVGPFKRGGR